MEKILPFEDIKKIVFSRKPTNIPIDIRAIYKIVEILLIIKKCGWRDMADLQKIHLANWLLNDSDSSELMKNMELASLLNFIHIDPTVNLAIDYAIGYKFLKLSRTGKLMLSADGNKVLKKIEENNLFLEEIQDIDTVNDLIKGRK